MRVLFVCTGNVCRSPVAERLTVGRARGQLGDLSAEVRVGSAGTDARTGDPVHPASAAALTALGGDPHGFGSRQLAPAHVRSADLVLTMTRRQRHATIAAAPTTLRRVFTLREAAGLLADVDPADLADVPLAERAVVLAGRLHASRRLRPSTAADDIRDPIGRSASVHTAVAGEIAELLGPLTEVLFQPVSTAVGSGPEGVPYAAPTELAPEADSKIGADVDPELDEEATGELDAAPNSPVVLPNPTGAISAPAGSGTGGTPRDPDRRDRPGRPLSARGQGRRR